MENALEFIQKSGGVTTERVYPYKAKDERCDATKVSIMSLLQFCFLLKTSKIFVKPLIVCVNVLMKTDVNVYLALQMNAPVVKIDGHENVPENNEHALMKAVANQPVSVAIDAGGSDMQFYKEVVDRSGLKSNIIQLIQHLSLYFKVYQLPKVCHFFVGQPIHTSIQHSASIVILTINMTTITTVFISYILST